MNTKKFLFTFAALFLILIIAISCNKSISVQESSNFSEKDLIGSWEYESRSGDSILLRKVPKLTENVYGILFMVDGKLMERSNNGWCGTPPIVTEDYEGIWSKQQDTIKIDGTYWGGKHTLVWKILKTYDGKLLIKELENQY